MPAWRGALLLLLLGSGGAWAKGFDYAFLPLDVPAADLASDEARALSEIYEEEVARLAFSAASSEAVRGALVAESRARGGRCEDVACAASVGRSLQVARVVRLRAVPYGKPNLILSLRWVDVRSGASEDRPAKEYSKEGRRLSYELFRFAVQEQLAQLSSLSMPLAEPLVAKEPIIPQVVSPAPVELLKEAPTLSKPSLFRSWRGWAAVGAGVGGVGLAAFGLAHNLQAVSKGDQLRELQGRNLLNAEMDRYRALSSGYQTDVAWMATGYAVGAAALLGAGYLFLSDRNQPNPSSMVVGANGVAGSFTW